MPDYIQRNDEIPSPNILNTSDKLVFAKVITLRSFYNFADVFRIRLILVGIFYGVMLSNFATILAALEVWRLERKGCNWLHGMAHDEVFV